MTRPQELDRHKFEAQQARRILDRLVGYQVSPLLWRKVKGGLSAGRVQTVALRIICERERAIQAFDAPGVLVRSPPTSQGDCTAAVCGQARQEGQGEAQPSRTRPPPGRSSPSSTARPSSWSKVQKKTVRKNPAPPFTTSKLQQESIRKLRFTAKKTMMLAQQLYEGIDLGPGEPVGLITYMRTDSTRIAEVAAAEAQRAHPRALRPRLRAGQAARMFKQLQTGPGCARGHPADARSSTRPEKVAPHLSTRPAGALPADLAALHRLPDAGGPDRPGLRLHRGRRPTSSPPAAPPSSSRVSWRSTAPRRRMATATATKASEQLPGPERGRPPGAAPPGAQAAFHPAAAALLGGLAREGAGGERHRPPQHLRRHPVHHPRQGLRGHAAGLLPAERARLHRERPAGDELSGRLRRRVHRAAWRRTSTGWSPTRPTPWSILTQFYDAVPQGPRHARPRRW
ncbi:MAG: DNA topoisomerase [Desulfobacterales bacterium]|nr:DNA topoisomerase [Desulfobacterales bacterium]